eukprot:CAMPEP_0168770246 /NCGR_PEP_ID=MMETSP0725-20121227/2816_1 /TAXON_ID=265536 /ORGANISM="Amphiprora sp., Strain CCMP467" /LENGTH=309 /DNA_ID=CAMNT_0008819675 /DNA_START=42 /DNA_END=971 /DNA_ORIENTATION=+
MKFLASTVGFLLASLTLAAETATTTPAAGFSSSTTVELKDGSFKSMEDLQVGDLVLVLHEKHQPVVAFGRKDASHKTSFVRIAMQELDQPLEMSADHLVYLHGEKVPVPASSVKVGDLVQGVSSPATVTKVDTVTREGYFAPITASGSIVVNGVVGSTYDSLQKDESFVSLGGVSSGLSYHFVSHVLHKPLVMYCKKIASERCTDQKLEGGTSVWSNMVNSMATWMVQSEEEVGAGGFYFRAVAFYALIPVVLAVFTLCTVMEFLHWMLWVPTFFFLLDLRNINGKVKAVRDEERAMAAVMKDMKEKTA